MLKDGQKGFLDNTLGNLLIVCVIFDDQVKKVVNKSLKIQGKTTLITTRSCLQVY